MTRHQAERPSHPNYAEFSTRQLLESYAAILTELLNRGAVRTRNSPLGDFAEYLVQHAYGGKLASNSTRSHDVLVAGSTKIQGKARSVRVKPANQAFSAMRSYDFDLAVFLLFDTDTYELLWAREVETAALRSLGRYSGHVNGQIFNVREISSAGVDVTPSVMQIYDQLR